MLKDRPGDDPTRCWGPATLVEGQLQALVLLVCPSTTSLRLAVPLPVPGRICLCGAG